MATCEVCGKEITDKRRSHFCYKECSSKYWEDVYNRERNTNGVRPHYFWARIVFEINERDNRTCQKCGYYKEVMDSEGNKYRVPLEVHHIIPLAIGGSNLPDNLITLCHECHAKAHPNGYKRQARRMRKNKPLYKRKCRIIKL